ncbi:MAG: hypothetical protein WBL95_23660 [Microcoleus sp.]
MTVDCLNAPCPMPHAPCPMPHAPCPMPHATCPIFVICYLLVVPSDNK